MAKPYPLNMVLSHDLQASKDSVFLRFYNSWTPLLDQFLNSRCFSEERVVALFYTGQNLNQNRHFSNVASL